MILLVLAIFLFSTLLVRILLLQTAGYDRYQQKVVDQLTTESQVRASRGKIYDANGDPYTEGVRYKRIPAELVDPYEEDLASLDGAYVITKIGDYCYMPLVINWFGTTPSDFTDYLEPYLQKLASFTRCGFAVSNELGTIEMLQEEFYQKAIYGSYEGVPTYNAFVFSTKLDSAMYDYSFNLTIDPDFYDDLSCYFLKDPADIHWLRERTLSGDEEIPETSVESGELTESEAGTSAN